MKRRIIPIDVLWVCETCRYIGSEGEAKAHALVRGHDVEALDHPTSDAIFAEWQRVGDPRAA